jgi:hypothetical protein
MKIWAAVLAINCTACSFSGNAIDDSAPAMHDDAAVDTGSGDAPSIDAKLPDGAACMTSAAYATRPSHDHRYRATPTGTYDDVSAACAADGAHLAVIDDDDENTYVASLAGTPYIGLDDLDPEHTFRWTTGATGAFTKWNSFEPNDAGANEDCASILPSSQGLRWNDETCDKTHAGVCECEPGYVAPPVPTCRTAAGGVSANGRIYFVHTGSASWIAAQDDCAAMGAYLMVPSDDTENNVVNGSGPLHVTFQAWIGLSRIGNTYTPVNGAPPGYTHWKPQAPYSGEDRCVVMNVSGQWENVACTAAHPYVCECDPAPP